MKSYLEILNNVLNKGRWKNNRTGTRTLTLANQFFSHDMSDGFPLLTTKKIAVKTMAVELEGFIKGIVDKLWYKARGCSIWQAWANPNEVQKTLRGLEKYPGGDWLNDDDARKEIQKTCNDLGVIYGYQWRKFGEDYQPNIEEPMNGVKVGYDQLDYIVQTLKTNPDDRRMVCSAWNPNQLGLMALPPCHFAFVITHIEGILNLHWTQR